MYEAFVVSEGRDATGQNWQRLLSAWDGETADDWMAPSWNLMRPHDSSDGYPLVYEPAIQRTSGLQGAPIRNVTIARSGIGPWQFLAGNIAEILIYERQLGSDERNKVGYYLQTKYGTSDGYMEPLTPTIRSEAASMISTSTATLNGTLAFTGSTPSQVRVYWGSSDGATSAGAWEASVDLGMSTLSTPETQSEKCVRPWA